MEGAISLEKRFTRQGFRGIEGMKKNVLVVDDDSLIRQLVSLILRSAGYTAIEAVNGADALNKLGSARVEMVITDLRMPQMDGVEFIRQLRKRPEHESTPVVMMTSDFPDYKKKEGALAGVNEWISKPFIPQQLMHTVRKFASERIS
jgi:two-component system chemotaxis response regulator CheY